MASLLEEYRRHAADHGVYTMEGDADASNASYDRLQDAFKTLIASGKRSELFELYSDIDPWVQCWAAAHTLELDEARALAKLDQLQACENPHVSSGVKYTIQEWKSGELTFSPQ